MPAENPKQTTFSLLPDLRRSAWGIEHTQDAVNSFYNRFNKGEFVLETWNLPLIHPPSEFRVIWDNANRRLVPTILINAQQMHLLRNGDPDKFKMYFQADLLRTIAIADQYPASYGNYLQSVYNYGLELQKRWLERWKVGRVFNDPRHINRRKLLKKLLGKPFYELDIDFLHWQKEIYRQRIQKALSLNDPWPFNTKGGSLPTFLRMRDLFLPIVHARLKGAFQFNPWEYDEDIQSTTAVLLVNQFIEAE